MWTITLLCTCLAASEAPRADRRRLQAYNYQEVAKLTAADGASYVGISVAIAGNTIVVGAYGDDDAGSSSGSAYIFSSDSSWWDYFSSDAATRPLPPAMVLLVARLAL